MRMSSPSFPDWRGSCLQLDDRMVDARLSPAFHGAARRLSSRAAALDVESIGRTSRTPRSQANLAISGGYRAGGCRFDRLRPPPRRLGRAYGDAAIHQHGSIDIGSVRTLVEECMEGGHEAVVRRQSTREARFSDSTCRVRKNGIGSRGELTQDNHEGHRAAAPAL
jgi:hypothetical protein